jgi:hypothetical protein
MASENTTVLGENLFTDYPNSHKDIPSPDDMNAYHSDENDPIKEVLPPEFDINLFLATPTLVYAPGGSGDVFAGSNQVTSPNITSYHQENESAPTGGDEESLKCDLNSEDDQIEHVNWILDTARMAFDKRCFLIDETLKSA